jgi:hypothetical protein
MDIWTYIKNLVILLVLNFLLLLFYILECNYNKYKLHKKYILSLL